MKKILLGIAVIASFVLGVGGMTQEALQAAAPRARHHRHRVTGHRATPQAVRKKTAHARPKHTTHRHNAVAVHADRIAAFVGTVQPKKGPRFARRVARAIRRSAKATGVAPEVILATGYVESEFRMSAGPCLGMMQVHPATLREMRRRVPAARGLDPDRIEDNIQLGALELAAHYRGKGKRTALASREARLSRAWARYNGSGVGGRYVRRARTVLHRFRKGDTVAWRRHLQTHGPLWN